MDADHFKHSRWTRATFAALAIGPALVLLGACFLSYWDGWSYLFALAVLAPVALYALAPRARVPTVSVFLPFVFVAWGLFAFRIGYVPQVARQLDAILERCVSSAGDQVPRWTCDDHLSSSDGVLFITPALQDALVHTQHLRQGENRLGDVGPILRDLDIVSGIDTVFGATASEDARGTEARDGYDWILRCLLPGAAITLFYQWLFLAMLPTGLFFALRGAPRNTQLMGFSGTEGDGDVSQDVFYYAMFALACGISMAIVFSPTGVVASIAGELVNAVSLAGETSQRAWIVELPQAPPLVFAAVGYLMYAVTNVGLAIGGQSVSSLTFLRLGRRGVLVILIGVAFTGLAGEGGADGVLSGTPHLIALLAGFVPGVAISRLTANVTASDADSLGRVPGLAMFTRGTLREAGIESITDLAYADIPRLVAQTGLGEAVIRTLVDRAILLDRIPAETQTAFAQAGVQHATDLVHAVSLPDTLQTVADNVKAQIQAHPNWPAVQTVALVKSDKE